MPNHNAAVPAPELVDKEIKVLELRRAGLTWQRIAEETGYSVSHVSNMINGVRKVTDVAANAMYMVARRRQKNEAYA